MVKFVLMFKDICRINVNPNAHVADPLLVSIFEVNVKVSRPAAFTLHSIDQLMPSTGAANVTLVLTLHIQIQGNQLMCLLCTRFSADKNFWFTC